MFYSHEILTNREHGVATIWQVPPALIIKASKLILNFRLVATLGSKSNLKKVTRKAILDVDVPKAIETIRTPPAGPMALRLQSNLLYGVTRVYSQQCGYLLSDAETIKDKLRQTMLALSREGIEFDPDAGKSRPEQINLPDDPAFVPDLNINIDLSMFDLPTGSSSSCASSLLGPPSLVTSSQSSRLEDELQEPQLIFPSEEASGLGLAGFEFAAGTSSIAGKRLRGASVFEESALINDPDFEIDGDGNLFTPADEERDARATSALGAGSRAGTDTGISERIRAEHEAGLLPPGDDQGFIIDDKDGIFMLDDDELPLSSALPFSPYNAGTTSAHNQNQSQNRSFSAHPPTEVSSIAEAAPQRRARIKPVILPDHQTELTNRELSAWNQNYLANMTAVTRQKRQFTSTLVQAKKNAKYLVICVGFSGVGQEFDRDGLLLDHPLRLAFSGQALFDELTGREPIPAGSRKRSRNSHEGDETDEEESRRVRVRDEDEEEVGRGDAVLGVFDDQDGRFLQGDDIDRDIEIGRHAPASLPDPETLRNSLPWNLHSSRANSIRRGLTSSVGGAGVGIDISSNPNRPGAGFRSRLTSASVSPLLGRGPQGHHRFSSLELPGPAGADESKYDSGELDDDGYLHQLGDDEAFELYGPAAKVSTQQAANSQWVANMLEDEADNFYGFLVAKISERFSARQKSKSPDLGSEEDGEDARKKGRGKGKVVTFEELLPAEGNSKVVGSQGLLHVLSLVTRGWIRAEQGMAFGEILLGVVEDVRPTKRNWDGGADQQGGKGDVDEEGDEGDDGEQKNLEDEVEIDIEMIEADDDEEGDGGL